MCSSADGQLNLARLPPNFIYFGHQTSLNSNVWGHESVALLNERGGAACWRFSCRSRADCAMANAHRDLPIRLSRSGRAPNCVVSSAHLRLIRAFSSDQIGCSSRQIWLRRRLSSPLAPTSNLLGFFRSPLIRANKLSGWLPFLSTRLLFATVCIFRSD